MRLGDDAALAGSLARAFCALREIGDGFRVECRLIAWVFAEEPVRERLVAEVLDE